MPGTQAEIGLEPGHALIALFPDATMNRDKIVDTMNSRLPPAVRTLNARVLEFLPESHSLSMQFTIGLEFCHTVDVVQGGFVTAMLDAAMSHALGAAGNLKISASTIDITVSFLKATRAGRHVAKGYVIKKGRTVGFMRGELYNEKGDVTATATASALIVHKEPD